MGTTIREYVAERGIAHLVHFTRARNLDSILRRGLLPRDTLTLENFDGFNDQLRLDNTHAVCMSITFPNYKMFWGCRNDHPDETWVVIGISPKVLWETECAFCSANAASGGVTAIPLAQRMGLGAMQAMFGDWPGKPRAELGVPDNYATNPQAEVLALRGVAPNYFLGVGVQNEAIKQQLVAKYPGLDVRVTATFFSARRDYSHWKA